MFRRIFSRVYERETADIRINHQLQRDLAARIRKERPARSVAWFKLLTAAGTIVLLAFLVRPSVPAPSIPLSFGPKVDDWSLGTIEQEPETVFSSSAGLSSGLLGSAPTNLSVRSMADMSANSADLGFAVGGAKDANNFRLDIENGYLPLPTDLTYEGLFYDYYFETGEQTPCEELFCPSYSTAVTEDPISSETEYYLSVGLNSGLTKDAFKRKPLNLVVVLDISGSMRSPFDSYHYDGGGNPVYTEDTERASAQKLDVAKDAIAALFGHLRPEDRLGFVVFDDVAQVAKPLNFVGETDMASIERHVRELTPRGGTNMSAGMEAATELFEELGATNEYEQRIIFLTDAMPNQGDTSSGGLFEMVEENAQDHVYTTFIGVGVDFQTELVERITKTRGANYFAVHSSEAFETQLDDGFELMVSPLVFDLSLKLEAEGWKIEQVYGSPEADKATGELIFVSTLFPSRTQDGETRGGVVLLKLRRTSESSRLTLFAQYENRDGKMFENEQTVDWPKTDGEAYDHDGIRKAVLLARYANLMKNWMIDERRSAAGVMPIEPLVNEDTGIVIPPDDPSRLFDQWEQTSIPLQVSESYENLFDTFTDYFAAEVDALGDDDLQRELDVLKHLN